MMEQAKSGESFYKRHQAAIVTTVVGLVGGAVVTWWLTGSIEPVYVTRPIEIIAQKASPRLGVSWDGVPIENLCVERIGLWNEGEVPMTQQSLPSSDPLRIVPLGKVHILAVENANASRPTLHIEPTIVAGDPESIQLAIAGGDALEKSDGVGLRILFTGDCQSSFKVVGRVISSNGFKEILAKPPLPYYPWWVGAYLGGALLMAVTRNLLKDKDSMPPWLKPPPVKTVDSMLYLFLIVATAMVIFQSYVGRSPSWLP